MLRPLSFQTTDWSQISKTIHPGTTGVAYWQTLQFEGLRVRMVEYSPGYLADHWCTKGHIVYCIKGEMVSELQDGREFVLSAEMTYQVSDDVSSHRSKTLGGCLLLIIDGAFLGA